MSIHSPKTAARSFFLPFGRIRTPVPSTRKLQTTGCITPRVWTWIEENHDIDPIDVVALDFYLLLALGSIAGRPTCARIRHQLVRVVRRSLIVAVEFWRVSSRYVVPVPNLTGGKTNKPTSRAPPTTPPVPSQNCKKIPSGYWSSFMRGVRGFGFLEGMVVPSEWHFWLPIEGKLTLPPFPPPRVFFLFCTNVGLSQKKNKKKSIYPPHMDDPMVVRQAAIGVPITVYGVHVETPINIYWAHNYGYCNINCLAYHDTHVLLAPTMERPPIVVPEFGHNSYARVMCIVQCMYTLTSLFLGGENGPSNTLMKERFLDRWGTTVRTHQDIVDMGLREAVEAEDWTMIECLAEQEDFHPYFIGQLIALQIEQLLKDNADGWNPEGTHTYDYETGQAVRCSTSNCGPFDDTTGYESRNPPGNEDPHGKYNVTGTQRHWRPLKEPTETGSFVRQQHVTPHIGFTTTPKLRPYRSVREPNYTDYREEALSVVETVRQTASDKTRVRPRLVRFYDDKLLVRGTLQFNFFLKGSFEESLLYLHGLDMVEHDALANAWREKVKHDLVRPTTIIQRWGDDLLDTYNGDPTSTDSSMIRARDFQAYIRVMPHSEYPSASACLCKSYADFTTAYTTGLGLRNMTNLLAFDLDLPGGELLDFLARPSFDPRFKTFFIKDMEELIRDCGDSRLWGWNAFQSIRSCRIRISGRFRQSGLCIYWEDPEWQQLYLTTLCIRSIAKHWPMFQRNEPHQCCQWCETNLLDE